MDVGQLLGTAKEPAQREYNSGRDDTEDFANYLREPDPKNEPTTKKEATRTEDIPSDDYVDTPPSTSEKPTNQANTSEDHSPAEAASDKAPPTAEEIDNTEKADSPAETVIVATAQPSIQSSPTPSADLKIGSTTQANPAAAVKDALNDSASNNAAVPGNGATEKALAPDAKIKSDMTPENTRAPEAAIQAAASVPPKSSKNSKAATSAAPTGSEKPTTQPTSEAKSALTATSSLEAVRAEATAKMSQKDALSSKIAEMLQDGKGKINLTATKQQQSFQTTLASSTNLVTATMTNNPAATAQTTIPLAGGEADGAATQALLSISGNAQGLPSDTTNQAIPTSPTGTVQVVDATATNSTSQAANAARANAQLPAAEQVSTQLSAAIKDGQDRIKISLHPSELGRVEVKIDVGHDGRVIAAVAVDKQETLDLLQRDARVLERALRDAGFDTGSNSLNFGLSQNGQDGQHEGTNFANLGLPADELGEDSALPTVPSMSQTSDMKADGGLDIQV